MASVNSNTSPDRQSSSTPLLEGSQNAPPNEATTVESISSSSSRRVRFRHIVSLLASPVTDDRGHWTAVLAGLSSLFIVGIFFGLSVPKNPIFSASYGSISSCLGYTYFLVWSFSFYPQVLSNYRRKTTTGLSVDFCSLNLTGFLCYAVYNVAMYGSPVIRRLYRERHGASAEIAVQSNDVAFAVHAVFLSTATLAQIFYYDASRLRQQPVSKLVLALIGGILMTATATGLLLAAGKAPASINWLDYLYLLSYFKILITLVKYVPQVFLNYQRRSTAGFSVWQILLDLSGGVLSDSQLVGDCLNLHDWSGITGNLAKFFLGFVSIVFDIIILLQHYVWFPEPPPEAIIEVVSEEEEEAAIANDKQDEESETVPIV